jgi:hypothetical protein
MSAHEFLLKKGFKKIHQPKKRYNLSIEELVTILEEFAEHQQEYKIANQLDMRQLKLWM